MSDPFKNQSLIERLKERKLVQRALAYVAGLAVLGGACQSAAQSSQDVASQFVGTWQLVSWESELRDGTTRPDPRSVGYIMYSDTGHMCYLSMDPDRPDWGIWSAPTGPEAVSAIMGIGAYCGRWEIDSDRGVVLHHVEVEKVPNNVGITRTRTYELLGRDRLALNVTDRSDLPPETVRVRLVWERVRN